VLVAPVAWLCLWLVIEKPLNWNFDPRLLLFAVVVYPILEELAFRGFIQTWLLEKKLFQPTILPQITRANVVTSLAFAALHLVSQPPLWAALVFLPSLIFGYLRERFDSVLPSIIVHAWYNLGFVILFVA